MEGWKVVVTYVDLLFSFVLDYTREMSLEFKFVETKGATYSTTLNCYSPAVNKENNH